MSLNVSRFKKIEFNLNLSNHIKAYLKKVASGFDRKSYNPPLELAHVTPNLPDEWIEVGLVPKPTTRFGWFKYHLFHGLLMGYPVHRVIAFSLIHTKYD